MKKIMIQVDGTNFINNGDFTDQQINQLSQMKLIRKYNKNDLIGFKLAFVGCIELSNLILVSLPYGVTELQIKDCTESQIRPFLVNVIKAIRQYSNKIDIVTSGKIAASFYLLDDLESNGLLSKYIKSDSKKESGKINWSKTIKHSIPTKIGETWSYTNFFRRGNTKHESHELTIIHKWAINQAYNLISLISDDYKIDPDDYETCLSASEINEIIFRIQPKLTKDRDIYVLDMIHQLVCNNDQYNVSAIYTKNFNLIWEQALQNVLKHDIFLKNKVPNVQWQDISTVTDDFNIKAKFKGGVPEVDIIFQANNTLHILDAKYYDLFNGGGRPGLTDLWKQFYYGQAYKAIFDTQSQPFNGFVFPCFMPDSSMFIKKFSSVKFSVNSESGEINNLTEIPAFIASIDSVLDCYLQKKYLQEDYLKLTNL